MTREADQHLHDVMSFVGIRAPLTAAAVIQLIRELCRKGLLDQEAIDRIKTAVLDEAYIVRHPHLSKTDFQAGLREHLERLLADKPDRDDARQ